ncbi:methionine aminotransferase [Salinimicrobium oceani]|uniref:Aminotransferase class I/II-fold pyridoxal phosphate-dependent enzyme n=1 Tax=Salinimicrobium oceani TaxID=2722702 RepID=A0ABX1CXB9_9FLAO|nr:methionine aminotransferase [Salinimicrobium oceani]NJW52925.1 aminotransferase class I/II-fold pyridoxal phosphate-dependent enzyme [Salinimicrobium oceani]
MPAITNITSKLPGHSTSIFTVMTQMALKHGAVNLSQGYPNFETDKELKDLVSKAMNDGYNQYAPLAGIQPLREQIVEKIENLHGKRYDRDSEVTVTNGATQALYLAITAFVRAGDEVIVLKPAYDSYEPAIAFAEGTPVPIQLEGKNYKLDFKTLKEKINSKTRMLIINTPHNPSGNVFSKDEMTQLENLLKDTNVILLSDEVYEHIIFDEEKHWSASSFPHLSKRAIICASFGKTFHNTGWKMGYCVAPEELMVEMQKVMEVNVFCVHHPTQRAFAEYLKMPSHYLELGTFYQEKRNKFLDLIRDTGFRAVPSKGTYFQLVDYSEISTEPDVDFSRRLITEYGIASIPVSVFNKDQLDYRQLRFCFAKTDETLEKAGEILSGIK